MRRTRILGEGPLCYYHVISRVIERRMIFDEREREYFQQIMRAQEGFSGVRVVTWTCLSNHFHMLVAVEDREAKGTSHGSGSNGPQQELQRLLECDDAFLDRLAKIYDAGAINELRDRLQAIRAGGSTAEFKAKEVARIKQPFLDRMFDLSSFVGEIKQRISQWFNKRNERSGPLWEDRFKSVLVQGEHGVLGMVAAYIDLNAVRAGIVKEPKDWRWCGYAEAVAAQGKARTGVYEALGELGQLSDSSGRSRADISWSKLHQRYRRILMHEALQKRDDHGRVVRKGITAEEFEAERAREFKLPTPALLHQRIRHFVDGLALGSEAFVESVFRKNRRKMGVKRKVGARLPKGEVGESLCGMRTLADLRGDGR